MANFRVRFSEPNGVEHVAVVEAKSVFEAVCRGWAAFMFAPGWELFEVSRKACEFVLEIVRNRRPSNGHGQAPRMACEGLQWFTAEEISL
jgi:hypothetical protein